MSKELGLNKIHVAHVVIDGGIDSAFVRKLIPKKTLERMPDDSLLNADDIARTYVHLATQKPNCWSFELTLRPFSEKWEV